MYNSVHLTALVAYVGDGFVIVDCGGVFVRCVGVDSLPIASFVDIRGRLQNVVRRNVAQVVVVVDSISIIE